jgi:hypothetical protein
MYLRDVIDELHQLLSKLDVTAATFNSFPSTFLARLSADSGATAAKSVLPFPRFLLSSILTFPFSFLQSGDSNEDFCCDIWNLRFADTRHSRLWNERQNSRK